MERIMNEENDWYHNMKADAIEGPVVCACREEQQALNKIRKSPWTFRSIIGDDCC